MHKRSMYSTIIPSILIAFLLAAGAAGAETTGAACTYAKDQCPDRMPPAGATWRTATQIVASSPPSSCPDLANTVARAEEKFWCIFNTQQYACMSELQQDLAGSLNEAEACKEKTSTSSEDQWIVDRNISLMHARLGFLYTWMVTELAAVGHHAPEQIRELAKFCDEHPPAADYTSTVPCGKNTAYHFDQSGDANKSNPQWWDGVPMLPATVAGFHSGTHGPPAPDKTNVVDMADYGASLLRDAVTQYPWFNIPTPMIATFLTPRTPSFHTEFISQGWRVMQMCAKLPAGNQTNGVHPTAGALSKKFVEEYSSKPYITSAPVYRPDIDPVWDGLAPQAHAINKVCGNNSANNGNTNVSHSYPNNLLLLGDMIYYNCYQAEKNADELRASALRRWQASEYGLTSNFRCGKDWRSEANSIYKYARDTTPAFTKWLYRGTILDRIEAIEAPSETDAQMLEYITAYNRVHDKTDKEAAAYSKANPPCMICHQRSPSKAPNTSE